MEKNHSNAFVGKIMKDHFHMSYKRVKVVSFKGNSERCLVLRQLCAKVMLDEMNEGKILVSID